MARIWVAILTLFIYALAQFLPLVLAQTPIFNRLSGMALGLECILKLSYLYLQQF